MFASDTRVGSDRSYLFVGDSFTKGSGDSYLNGDYLYSIAHRVAHNDQINIINTSSGGGSSFSTAINAVEMKKVFGFSPFLDEFPPIEKVVIFFYEGNDLNDNLRDLKRLGGREGLRLRMKQAEEMPLSSLLRHGYFYGIESVMWNIYKQLHFKELMTKVLGEKSYDSLKVMLGMASDISQDSTDPSQKNLITREGQSQEVYSLQSAAMELSPEELTDSLNVFKESVFFLKRNFRSSIKFKIVYLPSIVAAYETMAPVYIQTYQNGRNKISYAENLKRSQLIRSEIEKFAAKEKISYVDTTQQVIEAGRKNFIHGPKDWKHFNQKGYDVVYHAIKENF